MHNRTWQPPDFVQLNGQFVTLNPLIPQRDIDALYAASHGSPEKEAVWNYLFYGPFDSLSTMKDWMETNLTGKSDPLTWTVFENSANTPVGIVALLAIAHNHGRAEIGHVWFTPAVHKTKVNTESQFLLLQHLFDRHCYRRVEWKCDSLNHASRTAAARMGFIYEGRFRQHMFVRGKNRDTDWFAMTDKEWPRCKTNFERWLYSNEKISLMELNNS
ncbi:MULTISPECIES: GNAT family N-acetyltransferase [Nostoc]|uniref:GNAT family N-acetyltransferase n=1 Tax=Nostoc paludosum FACHB-159 TaxID=2692908 RepID=A0ABR8KA29_9NOSO|nr:MULTISPECIES: GNAT family protein [Nostoc]MBD2680090.1 GNAT family N-acetyltransferase [Nostoc sp. FACHB-857]MBD2736348.1 GNAT family N-acetyltransferase [Nostoc paludosum FACHB-159]